MGNKLLRVIAVSIHAHHGLRDVKFKKPSLRYPRYFILEGNLMISPSTANVPLP